MALQTFNDLTFDQPLEGGYGEAEIASSVVVIAAPTKPDL